MHSIRWTSNAVKSYNALIARTSQFERKLDDVLNVLETFPISFPFDDKRNVYKAVINKRHILFYDVYPNNTVYLILFFDTKMNPKRLKKML